MTLMFLYAKTQTTHKSILEKLDKIPEEAHTTSIHAPSANIRGLYSLHLMSSKSKPTEVISQSTNQSHLKNPENTVAKFAEAHTCIVFMHHLLMSELLSSSNYD